MPNIPNIDAVLKAAGEGKVQVTPPIKPFLEEKMWFALFWLQPLREFWRRELGEKYFLKLREVIPYSWLLDPTPLPLSYRHEGGLLHYNGDYRQRRRRPGRDVDVCFSGHIAVTRMELF